MLARELCRKLHKSVIVCKYMYKCTHCKQKGCYTNLGYLHAASLPSNVHTSRSINKQINNHVIFVIAALSRRHRYATAFPALLCSYVAILVTITEESVVCRCLKLETSSGQLICL